MLHPQLIVKTLKWCVIKRIVHPKIIYSAHSKPVCPSTIKQEMGHFKEYPGLDWGCHVAKCKNVK